MAVSALSDLRHVHSRAHLRPDIWAPSAPCIGIPLGPAAQAATAVSAPVAPPTASCAPRGGVLRPCSLSIQYQRQQPQWRQPQPQRQLQPQPNTASGRAAGQDRHLAVPATVARPAQPVHLGCQVSRPSTCAPVLCLSSQQVGLSVRVWPRRHPQSRSWFLAPAVRDPPA